jgi:hypothetical protein
MTRPPAVLTTLLIPVVALVLACSGVSTTNPPPTPTPTPSPTYYAPVPPTPTAAPTATASPTPEATATTVVIASPTPADLPWVEIETEMLMLELRGEGLPIENDEMGDGLSADGSAPRDMTPDLDLRRSFGGWAMIDQSQFGNGGFFDCALPNVLCGNNPQPLGGNKLVLVGLQTYGDIDAQIERDGQLAVCFNRLDQPKSPDGAGSFGGCDLVVIADLTSGTMFELVYNGQFQARDTVGRARVEGDTALFVMPLGMDEEPGYRVVTFERIPPQTPGAGRTDTLPSGEWAVDSFFDIFHDIESL